MAAADKARGVPLAVCEARRSLCPHLDYRVEVPADVRVVKGPQDVRLVLRCRPLLDVHAADGDLLHDEDEAVRLALHDVHCAVSTLPDELSEIVEVGKGLGPAAASHPFHRRLSEVGGDSDVGGLVTEAAPEHRHPDRTPSHGRLILRPAFSRATAQ